MTRAHVWIKSQEKNGKLHIYYPRAIVCCSYVFIDYGTNVFLYNPYITVCKYSKERELSVGETKRSFA